MNATPATTRFISAASAKRAASLFHYGNLAAAIVPGFAIPWFGLSMLVFAVNSHHPDARVLDFNRRAARNFYPVMAVVLLTIAAGFGGLAKDLGVEALVHAVGLDTWARRSIGMDPNFLGLVMALWILLFVVLVPLTIKSLIDIQRTPWRDMTLSSDAED